MRNIENKISKPDFNKFETKENVLKFKSEWDTICKTLKDSNINLSKIKLTEERTYLFKHDKKESEETE